MTYAVLVIIPIAILLVISDYHYRHQTESRLRRLGDVLFGKYWRSFVVWELIMFSVFLDVYFELLAPDLLYSDAAIVYWILYIYFLVGIALWNHLRFYPIEVKEQPPGYYLVEVAEEKSASSDLEEFFTKLILRFENQPQEDGYDEYQASKAIFMTRDDEIGIMFREILSKS